MAYINQETKARLAPAIKQICKRYGVKATISISHRSGLHLNISAGTLDILGEVNEYNARRYASRGADYAVRDYVQLGCDCSSDLAGKVGEFIAEVSRAMNDGNHDRSDIQTDYFDVGWYTRINVGDWNRPYKLIAA